jgi:hypothetical protein
LWIRLALGGSTGAAARARLLAGGRKAEARSRRATGSAQRPLGVHRQRVSRRSGSKSAAVMAASPHGRETSAATGGRDRPAAPYPRSEGAMHPSLLAIALLATTPSVQSQSFDVRLTPAAHRASVAARFDVTGRGVLRFRLNAKATVGAVFADGEKRPFRREGEALAVDLDGGEDELLVRYEAVYEEDVEKGEKSGQIHNFSVNAHIGEEGVFLAAGSAWHPQWIEDDGTPHLVKSSVRIEAIDGWAFVASGNPSGSPDAIEPSDPIWTWETPRPVEGVAIAGNRHELHGRVHQTAYGPVQVVMHVPPEHGELASMFIDAACRYLDLYVPLLGAFPYHRFSIVENFFSSGFAFPGFTLLGPKVVAMAPRSLAPGYLDHELVHNWWGNGVYTDPRDGDWCEALATYSANYYRRIADGGEEAGRTYRRGILMTLSSDPQRLDDGALGRWGSAGAEPINRFVGYEKGAFVLMMLERGRSVPGEAPDRAKLWLALRRFAAEFLGKRASWDDLRKAIEAGIGESREAFFQKWVREHTLPLTPSDLGGPAVRDFYRNNQVEDLFEVAIGEDREGPWREIDPNFLVYRVLPPNQIIPTVAGTFGRGGVTVETESDREEVKEFVAQLPEKDGGENLLIIGHAAIQKRAGLIERCANPIVIGEHSFEIDGTVFDAPDQAVLHSMPYPNRPGRFITIFHSNGDGGWSHLRLIRFYTRDSTVAWEGDEVVARGTFEPSRKIHEGRTSGR